MVPVHVAAYRERGVLRRFAAAGFPRWSFALASGRGRGDAHPGRLRRAARRRRPGLRAAAAAPAGLRWSPACWSARSPCTGIGLLIGSLVPSARAAQGVGLLAVLPVLPARRRRPATERAGPRRCAAWPTCCRSPTSPESIRDPWLGVGTGAADLAVVAGFLLASALGWWRAVRSTWRLTAGGKLARSGAVAQQF